MYDQPLIIVIPNDPQHSIPHKSQNASIHFVHPKRWTLTNKKLLFIWNFMALFVMVTVYFYSEHEVTLQLQSRYAQVSIIEQGAADNWDEFTQWFSGASEWVPNPNDDNVTFGNDSDRMRTFPGDVDLSEWINSSNDSYDADSPGGVVVGSGDDQQFNYSSSNLSEPSVQIRQWSVPSLDDSRSDDDETSSLFIYRIERILTVVSNILNTTKRPTATDIRRVLEGLVSHYSGPMRQSINSLLDGIRNAAILDNFRNPSLDNLSLKFLPESRSPCWVEVLLPGEYYQRIRDRFTAATRWRMSRIYKDRLGRQTMSWRMRCFPAFFLGGFPKCGTTDLYLRLGTHSDVYASKHKEPHWWTRKRLGLVRATTGSPIPVKVYANIYDRMADELVMKDALASGLTVDGSASTIWDYMTVKKIGCNVSDPLDYPFFYNATTAYQISRVLPDSRMVVIVRDPVSRIYSEFLYFHGLSLRGHAANGSLQEVLRHQIEVQIREIDWCMNRTTNDTIRCVYWVRHNTKAPLVRLYVGMYHVYIELWWRYFSIQNLLVVQLEEYNSKPALVLQRIIQFLGLDSYPGDVMRKIANGDHHYNARKQDAEPLGEDIAYMLWSFYKPHNQRLASLLTDDKFLWS